MSNEVDITIRAKAETAALEKAQRETDAMNTALLRLAKNDEAAKAADRAAAAFARMTQQEKDAIIETDRLAREQADLARKAPAGAPAPAAPGGTGWTEFASKLSVVRQAFGGLQQAAATYNQVVNATVGTTAAYATQVRQVQQVSGQSAEATSQLIQLTDDYKISVSDLMMTQRQLTKDGKTLTVDMLANVADAYNAAGSQAEKNKIAQDNLGRSWRSYVELLQQGGSAIREMSAEQSGSLILTQQQVDAYRQWEMSVDAAEDATASIAAALGNVLTPAVTEFNNRWAEGLNGWAQFITGANNAATEMQRNSEIAKRADAILAEYDKTIYDSAGYVVGYTEATEEQTKAAWAQATAEYEGEQATKAKAAAVEDDTDSAQANAEALAMQQKALQELTAANQAYISFVSQVASVVSSNEKQQADLIAQRTELQAEFNRLYAQGYRSTAEGSKLGEINAQLAAIDTKITETSANYREQMNQMIVADVLKRLSTDGLTEAETAYYQKIQMDLGLLTQAQIDQANQIRETAAAIAAGAPGGAGGAPIPGQASAAAQGGAAAQWTETQRAADSYAQAVVNDSRDVVKATDELTEKFTQKAEVIQSLTDIEAKALSESAENIRGYTSEMKDAFGQLIQRLVDYIAKLEQAIDLANQLTQIQPPTGEIGRGGMRRFGAYSVESLG